MLVIKVLTFELCAIDHQVAIVRGVMHVLFSRKGVRLFGTSSPTCDICIG
jgi:hypothetical protein